MPRWVRISLTILAAAIGGWGGLIGIGGGTAGIAWIFLFGDDPWPPWSDVVIPLIALAGALAGAFILGSAAWRFSGKQYEA